MADGITLTTVLGGAALALSAFTLLSGRERKGGGNEQDLATVTKAAADLKSENVELRKDVADVRETNGRYDERLKTAERELSTLREWRQNINGEAARILAQSFKLARER